MRRYQGTVSRKISFTGVGVHSGRLIDLTIEPAECNQGILFQRTDSPNASPVLASPDNVSCTRLCTTLGVGRERVSTVEHLMAAFYGLGIDNALVSVNADEIPILDGSSAPFVDKLEEIGVQIQGDPKLCVAFSEGFAVKDGDQVMEYRPLPGIEELRIDYTIDFPRSQAIGTQSFKFRLQRAAFKEICEARTFCHIEDVTAMRSVGLALGGSLDNAVVVDNEKVVNNDGLRFDNEFVRHKVLDCIGDIALLGSELYGEVRVVRGGHSLHKRFVQEAQRRSMTTDASGCDLPELEYA